MTEPTLFIALKHLVVYVAAPLLGLFAWIGRRLYKRVDTLEHDLIKIDKEQAVQASQLKDIKDDIHQINKKLDRILDKLTNH